eukprot:1142121-Pelagomonas_calceolata.AAC.3
MASGTDVKDKPQGLVDIKDSPFQLCKRDATKYVYPHQLGNAHHCDIGFEVCRESNAEMTLLQAAPLKVYCLPS